MKNAIEQLTTLRNEIAALFGADAVIPKEDRWHSERHFTLKGERVELKLNNHSQSQGRATLALGYGQKEWVGMNIDKDTAETMAKKIRDKFLPVLAAKVEKEKYEARSFKEEVERKEWAIGEFKKTVVASGIELEYYGRQDERLSLQSGHIGQVDYQLGKSGFYSLKPYTSFAVAPADVLAAVAEMNAVIEKYRIK